MTLIRATTIVKMNHKEHKRPLSRRDKEHWLFMLGRNYKLLFFEQRIDSETKERR